MSVTVYPFLMFTGTAEAAMNFYVSVVPDSRIVSIEHFTAEDDGEDGKVKAATFEVAGQLVRCFDSYIEHAFTFTPAFSLVIATPDIADVERYATALAAGGDVLMPPDDYGFSKRFAWVQDRFGVSWQINCE
ncbi:MAG: VOC family protein [Hyphomicrobiaceae bacterium]